MFGETKPKRLGRYIKCYRKQEKWGGGDEVSVHGGPWT